MNQETKNVILDIFQNTVKYAFSSQICSEIYRLYPEAFLKKRDVGR